MIEILKPTHIDDKDLHLIANLYWRQTASVKVENLTTTHIDIKREMQFFLMANNMGDLQRVLD